MSQQTIDSRRSFFARFGMGGLAALLGPSAFAQSARTSSWSQEYWTQKGDVKLYMFRKRRSAPKAGERPLPVLFLVHGSSLSGRPTFDLTVPGRGEYSLMETFAGYGFDVWTMDFEGYGSRRAPSGTRTSRKASGISRPRPIS